MDIFISWSGSTSQQIAEELHNWIPKVLQFAKPYFTPSDIEKGAKWESEITSQLNKCSIGLLCLTSENTQKPWMLFEAGALSSKINKSRVCPLLFGLNNSDLTGPLATFQTTVFSKVEFKKLISMINSQLDSNKLSDSILEDVFETYYPRLEKKIDSILSLHKSVPLKNISNKRTDRDILEEILELTRRQYNPRNENTLFKKSVENKYIHIDISDFKKDSTIEIPIYDNCDFRDFLDDVYHRISKYVSAFTYEYDWILVDGVTGKKLNSVVKAEKIPKGKIFSDNRNLYDVGIIDGMHLIAKRL